MEMYSQPEGVKFGYKKDDTKKFKYNMQENYLYGRYCKSGLGKKIFISSEAVPEEMECVKIDAIVTNKGITYAKDFKCTLSHEDDACKYYFGDSDDENNLIN